MKAINIKITGNGTPDELLAALKDLVESIETFGFNDSEDAWVMMEVEE